MDEAERIQRSGTGVERLAERVDAVAGEVVRALSAPLVVPDEVSSHRRWLTTGVGASEGPARLFAWLLREEGVAADFVPISSFAPKVRAEGAADGPKGTFDEAPPADACVVVSQCLSPNARLPLARAASYARTILVTTIDADALRARGISVVRHGPTSEDGLLLRVVGPAAANATMIRLAAAVTHKKNGSVRPPLDVAEALRSARARAERALEHVDPAALFDLAAIVATGTDTTLCDGLPHKLLEGTGNGPPIWDVCSLVHGPLQSFYDRDATLLVLEREGASPDLGARLSNVLRPRHRVVRLRSPLPGPLALLDFDLQIDHLLLAALRARPRDLVDWPGKGRDGALYELGKGI